jgi:diacylglycerol kinase family enzyme
LKEVTISGDPLAPFYVHADGEPLGRLPLHVRLSPARLRVLIP